MNDYRDDQTCKAKTGLLFLRDCGSIVKHKCMHCGRPVCREHSIETQMGTACPECSAPVKDLKDNNPAVRHAADRNHYYNAYGYAPYYYGYTHYFSDHDFHTFEDREIEHIQQPETLDDVNAEDDYMES